MRKPILAGNWKMNKTRDEVIQFTLAVTNRLPLNVECIVCAPAIYLRDLVKRSPDNLHIGAQNMHELDSGAYTGEISPIMLKDTGVEYVILGHSERREYFNETDAKINAKIKKALEVGLKPIICVG
jgi:triosephosphate isomerase